MANRPSPIITLLTDFGTADSYVAEVKAQLLTRARGVELVDVTHDVPPGDVMAAQYLLARAWRRFPPGTIHLAVVDPGVGTDRRALAGAAGDHFFVGPDNGIFSFVAGGGGGGRWVALAAAGDVSTTFHGRDVFAPAAGALAAGADLDSLGREVTDPVSVPLPAPRAVEGAWEGEVIYVDRFGTLVTNLPGDAVDPTQGVRAADVEIRPLERTFGDVASGELVAFVGSGGTVEIAVRDGSAAKRLGVGRGARVSARGRANR